jgi:3-dehydroquinate synthase
MNKELAQARVFFESEALENFSRILRSKDYGKVAVLCDSNTQEFCLPAFLAALPELPSDKLEVLEIEPGEEQKSIEVLAQLWDAFGALNLERNSLLVNLGGGVISDLGGFAAACYMRGIDFVNFPTSLLAMADASVGAKTGINFAGFKNRIGLFVEPIMVGILPAFLKSLAAEEMLSGWAEMLKHGLIADEEHYQDLIRRKPMADFIDAELLDRSVAIKASVVNRDQKEAGLRKVLNFGHTVGHALEAYYATQQNPISHGHAVALGMQVELSLSTVFAALKPQEAETITKELGGLYPFPDWDIEKEAFLKLMRGDKKNQGQQLRFTLLAACGRAVYDIAIPESDVWEHLQKFTGV